MSRTRAPIALFLTLILACLAPAPAGAQALAREEDPAVTQQKRQTLARLMRRITIEFADNRLEDVVEFIETVTQTDLEPRWIDDRTGFGLNPDATVTLAANNVTALELLERVIAKIDTREGFTQSTWQFTPYGAFEFGPKERLNARRRIELYDIRNLLVEAIDFDNAPDFDLDQAGGGQGGGGSPFGGGGGEDVEREPYEDRVAELVDILIANVEPDHWIDNGGEAATVREFQGNLLINAPDYVHRQIGGYPWWPSRAQRARVVDGRRTVTFQASTGVATGLDDFEPVQASGMPDP